MVRRALPGEGQGRLALSCGCRMLGQTWQEAGAREVLKETGVAIEPASLRVVAVETTPDRRGGSSDNAGTECVSAAQRERASSPARRGACIPSSSGGR
jgi:ADP-ribose pyrophosphatase YjhB (NUDIX family)